MIRTRRRPMHCAGRWKRGGFSLIEAAVATALVGMGITAMVLTMQAGTTTNAAGRRITEATFIAQEIREWTLRLPFVDPQTPTNPPGPDGSSPQTFVDDLNDLMGVTYSPPRDAFGTVMSTMTGWSQTITMTWRDPNNLTTPVANGASDIVHVQVSVSYQGKEILTTGYLVARRSSE